MSWMLLLLSAGCCLILMFALSVKWELPRPLALGGMFACTLAAAVPFLWIYPRCQTTGGRAIAFFSQIALALGLAMCLVMMRFWRDPERVPPEKSGVVLSAADGRVVYVTSIDRGSTPIVTKGDKEYCLSELTGTDLLISDVYVVGVGMSLLDVHVNRCPISGQVKLVKHIAGKFMSLKKDEAPFVNERCTTVIESAAMTVSVVQIASRLVRCVQNYLKAGDTVETGQRLGMIKFGSLVAVIVPRREDVRIEVKPGDCVQAGISVVARYRVDPA